MGLRGLPAFGMAGETNHRQRSNRFAGSRNSDFHTLAIRRQPFSHGDILLSDDGSVVSARALCSSEEAGVVVGERIRISRDTDAADLQLHDRQAAGSIARRGSDYFRDIANAYHQHHQSVG